MVGRGPVSFDAEPLTEVSTFCQRGNSGIGRVRQPQAGVLVRWLFKNSTPEELVTGVLQIAFLTLPEGLLLPQSQSSSAIFIIYIRFISINNKSFNNCISMLQ